MISKAITANATKNYKETFSKREKTYRVATHRANLKRRRAIVCLIGDFCRVRRGNRGAATTIHSRRCSRCTRSRIKTLELKRNRNKMFKFEKRVYHPRVLKQQALKQARRRSIVRRQELVHPSQRLSIAERLQHQPLLVRLRLEKI